MSKMHPKPDRDWRGTLSLPQTDFPMKAGLPQREPQILAQWQKIGLYQKMRAAGKGREKFILHDGPPYANGDIHIGHAMQKTLKDVVCRAQHMMGKDAPFVPGWDCHGLPIEWKIEEQYRAKGQDKDTIPAAEFRAECRGFAAKWVDIQRGQFQRLGIVADWDTPYLTMDFESEARIVEEFHKFAMQGALYHGAKPVMWSVVEQTALAEAEVEYEEIVSPTIFVKFPIAAPQDAELADSFVVIWTTTPWTIPGNRAIAYAKNLSYGLYQAGDEKLLLCDTLAERVMAAAQIEAYQRLRDIDPSRLTCRHAFCDAGYDFAVPLLAGDFVTDEVGTGLVHIAPGHGQDDFELARAHGIATPTMIDGGGVYLPEVPLFAGKRVLDEKGKAGDANGAVIAELAKCGALLAKGKLRHQYPHSWRSKAPLIFRATPQWFINMEAEDLRARALAAIDATRWQPPAARNRIHAMVATRPDWVVSRQRAWGVPLGIFTDKKSGAVLRDEAVNARIVAAIKARGADAWFDTDPQEFLGKDYDAADYLRVDDILDVWFDSGVTHAFVLEARADQSWPANVYLEGSDQHRGWFQSSLLTACATRGRAPYEAVVTHGFVMDEQGRKMSKSAGNVVEPQKLIDQSGADIIRLWVMSSDYSEDMRIGAEIIKSVTDSYRKMRNTLRFLLGNLGGFTPPDNPPRVRDLPELEQFMLHRLAMLDADVRDGYANYDFRKTYQSLFNFMTLDLSAFYFDIRKDALYCDAPSSHARQACLYLLDRIFDCLTAWLAPMLVFTMEEVWQSRFPDPQDSVHLRQFPSVPADWRNPKLAEKWEKIRTIRRVVTGALEIERREKRIGSSLEAAPLVHISDAALLAATQGVDMADICITSQITLTQDAPPKAAFTLDDVAAVAVTPQLAQGKKCARSWKILPDVGSDPAYPDLSARDARAVAEYDANHSPAH